MIAKITHGSSAIAALAYDHGPGRADEHHDPRRVAGNLPGKDWQTRAQHMQNFVSAHQHTDKDQGIYRIALANPQSDQVLTDQQWRAIIEQFVARFGADKGMWEATRHDDHHIHLTISKILYDGTRMSTSHDYARVAKICRDLEREHGLTNATQHRQETPNNHNPPLYEFLPAYTAGNSNDTQPEPSTKHTPQKPDTDNIAARRAQAYAQALQRATKRQQNLNQPEPPPPTQPR